MEHEACAPRPPPPDDAVDRPAAVLRIIIDNAAAALRESWRLYRSPEWRRGLALLAAWQPALGGVWAALAAVPPGPHALALAAPLLASDGFTAWALEAGRLIRPSPALYAAAVAHLLQSAVGGARRANDRTVAALSAAVGRAEMFRLLEPDEEGVPCAGLQLHHSFAGALRGLMKAIDLLAEADGGPRDPIFLAASSNLGRVSLGGPDDDVRGAALSYLRDALAGWEAAIGPNHPDTLTACADCAEARLGGTCGAQGHGSRRTAVCAGCAADKVALLRRAFQGRLAALGGDHPLMLASAHALSVSLHALGGSGGGGGEEEECAGEALDLIVRASEGRARVLGADDPDTLASMDAHGAQLAAAGRDDEAAAVLREAFERRAAARAGAEKDTARDVAALAALAEYACLLERGGCGAEAAALRARARAARQRAQDAGAADPLLDIHERGMEAMEGGRQREGEGLLNTSFDCWLALDPAHECAGQAIDALASFYLDADRYDETAQLWRRLHAALAREIGADDGQALYAAVTGGLWMLRCGQAAQAEPILRDALVRRQRRAADDPVPALHAIRCWQSACVRRAEEHGSTRRRRCW
jgi:hypothetical protein